MKRRSWGLKGEENPHAVFTLGTARFAKYLGAFGIDMSYVGRHMGIHHSTLSLFKKGKDVGSCQNAVLSRNHRQ